MKHDSAGNPLITPDERMAGVPVKCSAESSTFGWQGIRVENYPDLPESDIYCGGMNHHLLVYHYRAMDGIFFHECAGNRTQTQLFSGQVSFIPAGADNRWTFGDGRPSALHILLDADLFNQTINEDLQTCTLITLRDNFQASSPELAAMSRLFGLELVNGGQNGSLYADALATALCQQLYDNFGGRTRFATASRKANIEEARYLIHDEFHRTITLQELANLTQLSKSQFVRKFKHQTGFTPHRYLLKCRIETAKQRMRTDKNLVLSSLAAELGFADQSHFVRQFRRSTGVTPTAFLKSN